MQRRRIAVAAAVVAAAGAAVAFTLPSMAGTTRPETARHRVPPPAESPRNCSRRCDATWAWTATRRDPAAAGGVGRQGGRRDCAAQTGAAFGGSWLAKDGTTLKVAVTDAGPPSQVEAAGAEAGAW